MQTLSPGAQTPAHYHECEEAVIIQSGPGCILAEDQKLELTQDGTVIIPLKVVHQIVNGSNAPMRLVAALSETPARFFTPDGNVMKLPWQQGAL